MLTAYMLNLNLNSVQFYVNSKAPIYFFKHFDTGNIVI